VPSGRIALLSSRAGRNRDTQAKMARKSNPQPLTLGDAIYFDREREREREHNFLDSPSTPLSPKSPKSPKSPFKFTTKKSQGEQSMQPAEPQQTQQTRADLPQSQTLPALYQYSAGSGEEERQGRERPTRSGFFSNYKASKSSSRLQHSETVKPGTEDNMSRDTDRPAMPGKVSSQDAARNGTTHLVSPFHFR
jgi:hypothetical protein